MTKKKTATGRSTTVTKRHTPAAGDVFVYQIQGRILGVSRILQRRKMPPGWPMRKRGGWSQVATTPWIGKKAPSLAEPLLGKILRITHHNHKKEAVVCWVPGKPPANWTWLGSIPASPVEKKVKCICYGFDESHWPSGKDALIQWRWDHDREALLRQDERDRKAREQKTKALVRQQNAAAKAERVKLAATPLAELRDRKHFAHWRPFALPGAIPNSERILRETIDALIEPHKAKNKNGMLQVLQAGITKLNTLQDKKSCLLTIERDDLTTKFQELCHLCGLKSKIPQLMQWMEF